MTPPPSPPPRPRRRTPPGVEPIKQPLAHTVAESGENAPEVSSPAPGGAPDSGSHPSVPPRALAPRPYAPQESRDIPASPREVAPRGEAPLAFPTKEQAVEVDINVRIRERAKARRRLLLHRFLVITAIVTAVVVTVWSVWFSPIFALEKERITITGMEESQADSLIVPVVDPYVGTPLPRLSTGSLHTQIEEFPEVVSATVVRSWPRGLLVTIEPRVPAGMVVVDGGYALVGSDGVTVEVVPDQVEGLPLITVSATEEDKMVPQAESALEVWDSLPQPVQSQVESITVEGSLVSLSLTTGAEVVWGDSEESDIKAEVLGVLVDQHPADVYDLRDPRRPVVR